MFFLKKKYKQIRFCYFYSIDVAYAAPWPVEYCENVAKSFLNINDENNTKNNNFFFKRTGGVLNLPAIVGTACACDDAILMNLKLSTKTQNQFLQ